jgi:drug/metabolite transporter (DMT)-like permease
MPLDALLLRLAPIAFVLIWSTGWIAAGYAAPYADPLTFLSLRFALAAVLLALIAAWAGAAWPRDRAGWGHALFVGVLLHGLYLAGVWWAVRHGVPAGISGLLAALQPILTVALAPALLGERISAVRVAGTTVGLLGIGLVLAPKFAGLEPAGLVAVGWPILINALAMVASTLGAFHQKRHQQTGDLRSLTAIQYLGALGVTLPLALALEPMAITWNLTVVLVMAWSVVGLSLGGIGLFLLLIRRGEVSRAASLIYLVPPAVALEAFVLFGEQLTVMQLLGVFVTVIGVILANRH